MKRSDFIANRKRKIRIEMHLTEDEHYLFLQRMNDAGIQNMQAYLRRMALTGYILRLDLSEVWETLQLISKTSSNINQLAKRANETHSIHAQDIIRLQDEVWQSSSESVGYYESF